MSYNNSGAVQWLNDENSTNIFRNDPSSLSINILYGKTE